MEIEERAAALLRDVAVPLVELDELHGALAAGPDGPPCDPATLARRLAARPDQFFVLERASPLVGAEDWPPAARAAYEAALREAGWECGPVVGCLPAMLGAGASAAGRVGASLAELAAVEGGPGPLRTRVQRALPLAEATMRVLAEAARMRRAYERENGHQHDGGGDTSRAAVAAGGVRGDGPASPCTSTSHES